MGCMGDSIFSPKKKMKERDPINKSDTQIVSHTIDLKHSGRGGGGEVKKEKRKIRLISVNNSEIFPYL